MYVEEYKKKHKEWFNDKDKVREAARKSHETKIAKGLYLPAEEYRAYCNVVNRLSNKAAEEIFTGEELSKRALCGTPGGLQLDHIFSKKQGFLNNVPPEIISHPRNLRLIRWEQNLKKSHECEFTIEELYEITGNSYSPQEQS